MRKSITRFLSPVLCALGLGAALQAQAAYTPVVVTGFNADIVANGTGTVMSSTTVDMDGGAVNTRYAFMAPNFVNPAGAAPTVFLPATGLINSATTSGLNFQLASYSANNSLRMPATSTGTGAGTLTLTTPQAAGEIYLLGSSGNGASTMTVTVTFTDATTQVFTGVTVADWFGGLTNVAIQGIGRVNYDNNTIENNVNDPRLYQIRLALAAANYAKPIQTIGITKTSAVGALNIMAVTLNGVCAGTPTGGTAVSSVASVCGSTSFTLSLTGNSSDVGTTYQWQSSTDNGVTWTNITGATGATYTVTGQSTNTQYRAVLTCTASALTATSAPVTVTTAAPTYATLPYIQSFENTWVDVCNTRDAPTTSWRNGPATGNNSWRREDDGASAAWTSPTSGGYSPVSSQGSHSARFHTYFASNNSLGNLDLYVNLSPAGAKRLSFDFVNTTGSDSLLIWLSNNGGVSFSRLGGYKLSATFTTQVLPIASTSATAVIRFQGRSDFGLTDIGLDNIVLESATGCLTPATLTASAITTTTASLSWLTGGTGTYTVLYGPTGFNPAQPASSTNVYTTAANLAGPPYAVTGLLPGTTYQFYVTLNCAGGTSSGTAGPVSFTTQIVNDEPCGATVLTINNTCTPLATTTFGATTTPSTVYGTGGQGTTCSTNTAPRDVWFQFTTAATGPTSTAVRISVTGGPASVVSLYSGTACAGPLTFRQCAGTAANTAAPNLDISSLTPSTTYYVRVSEYTSGNTLGNFTICATPIPNCTTPGGLAATAITSTTATLTWLAGAAGSTYNVYYGPTGFVPPAGTLVSGLTTTSAAITGLSPNTAYCFAVQQVCGGFNGSSTTSNTFCFSTPLTPPTNDEPCGAVTLTAGTAVSGTNVGATTTNQNSIFLPACAGGAQPQDVWFAFTPTGSSATFTFTGTAAGTLRLYTSPSCSAGPFNAVACRSSTANGVGFTTPVTFTALTAGTQYYLAVSGYSSTDTPGTFTLTATNVLAARAQADTNALLVYPNPSNTGQLTLRLSGFGGTGQATLLNALGQAVLTRDLASGRTEQTLNTRPLAAGLYTLRVAVDGHILTRKVVLE